MNDNSGIVFHADRYDIERIRQLDEAGQTHSRDIIRHPGAVVLLPITSDDQVVLIRNFRISIGQTLLELPAGTIEKGDSPEQTAERELIEETGYRAGKFQLLCKFYSSPGICDEAMYLFLATELTAGEPARESNEQIENQLADWESVRRWIADGTIQDAKTLVGLLRYLHVR